MHWPIDGCELFKNPAASLVALRRPLVEAAATQFEAARQALPERGKPRTIVACTPIRVQRGVEPQQIIVGHQGRLDDRQQEEVDALHWLASRAGLVPAIRRGGQSCYQLETNTRRLRSICDQGHAQGVLIGHDRVAYVYRRFAERRSAPEGLEAHQVDLSVVSVLLAAVLCVAGIAYDRRTRRFCKTQLALWRCEPCGRRIGFCPL